MSNIVAALAGGKGLRRPDASPIRSHRVRPVPAPAPEMYDPLTLFRRGALPLSNVRSTAIAAGLSPELVETAFSIATRRGELRIKAGRDGTILAVRHRP